MELHPRSPYVFFILCIGEAATLLALLCLYKAPSKVDTFFPPQSPRSSSRLFINHFDPLYQMGYPNFPNQRITYSETIGYGLRGERPHADTDSREH